MRGSGRGGVLSGSGFFSLGFRLEVREGIWVWRVFSRVLGSGRLGAGNKESRVVWIVVVVYFRWFL